MTKRTVVAEFYRGQGLGNQLYVYAAVRGVAAMTDSRFALHAQHLFKGHEIFDLELGHEATDEPIRHKLFERRVVNRVCGHDIGGLDQDLIERIGTLEGIVKVEGLLASTRYWHTDLNLVRSWLPFRAGFAKADVASAAAVLHVRGGDFLQSNSKLSEAYYARALERLSCARSEVDVVTDDESYARELLGSGFRFPSASAEALRHPMTAEHHRGGSFVDDFRRISTARQVIVSNSSFAFWAALLNPNARVIAPTHWSAHGCPRTHWSPGDSRLPHFEYV